MKRADGSIHEARVYRCLTDATPMWLSAREVAERAQVAQRTARGHLLAFVKSGVLDVALVFPEHRYRLSDTAAVESSQAVKRLRYNCEVFGLTPSV